MDLIYRVQISPFFEYSGYYDESTYENCVYSWYYLLLFLPFVLWIVDDRYNMFSQCIALFLLFFRIVPFTSEVMFVPQPESYILANVVYWLLILLFLKHWKSMRLFGNLKEVGYSQTMILLITTIFVLTVVLVSGVYCNFRIHLSLDDVYELRLEAREFDMPLILRYLQAATSNGIPILIIYFISRRNKVIVFLLAFVGLMNFSIAGHKSTLFKIVLCLGLYFCPKFDVKKYLPALFVTLCLMSIAEFYYIGTNALSAVIIRRGFYVPASLDISYYNYIIENGPTYFTEGIASKIGELSGDDEKRCNNGMFSDAFMNLGYLGCVFFPFIFSFFVKLFEHITNNLDNSIKLFSAFLIVTTLGSSYFTTSMLTHGLFLLGVILYFIPKRGHPKIISIRS